MCRNERLQRAQTRKFKRQLSQGATLEREYYSIGWHGRQSPARCGRLADKAQGRTNETGKLLKA